MDRVECIVAGAGVVGLAIARELALRGHEVLIVERESAFGTQTSARTPEVIHAGLYYPHGSLKGRLCVDGRDRLYAYLQARSLPFRQCGKLIVATGPDQDAALETVRATALSRGITLARLTAAQAKALEPNLHCTAALHSPLTGIFNSHAYMSALLADAEAAGAILATHTALTGGEVAADGFNLHFTDTRTAEPHRIVCRTFINAAGHGASDIAERIDGVPAHAIPAVTFAKGSYFSCPGRAAFQRLIYPVPETGGLGIHLTLDLQGGMRFGPDVEWPDRPDLTVDPERAPLFATAIRRYWPDLPEGALSPSFAGLRPKLAGASDPDFRIDTADHHGISGLVQLFGIESPGLTASLALAALVADHFD